MGSEKSVLTHNASVPKDTADDLRSMPQIRSVRTARAGIDNVQFDTGLGNRRGIR